jgi:hypothetical protein
MAPSSFSVRASTVRHPLRCTKLIGSCAVAANSPSLFPTFLASNTRSHSGKQTSEMNSTRDSSAKTDAISTTTTTITTTTTRARARSIAIARSSPVTMSATSLNKAADPVQRTASPYPDPQSQSPHSRLLSSRTSYVNSNSQHRILCNSYFSPLLQQFLSNIYSETTTLHLCHDYSKWCLQILSIRLPCIQVCRLLPGRLSHQLTVPRWCTVRSIPAKDSTPNDD